MDATTIAVICGFGLLCTVLLLVGGFVVLRFSGLNLGAIVDTISGASDSDPEDVEPERSRAGRRSLREKASDLDFDSAVAKYQGAPPAAGAPQGSRAQSLAERYKSSDPGGAFGAQSAPPSAPPPAGQPGYTPLRGSGQFGGQRDENFVNYDEDRRPLSPGSPSGLRRRRGSRDDEVYGGMLDEDGDGNVDEGGLFG